MTRNDFSPASTFFLASRFSLLPPFPRSADFSSNQDLLLLLQPLRHTQRNIQRLGHDVRRREREPLRQRDVGYAVGFVDFDPD
jgi:hypothetical protein